MRVTDEDVNAFLAGGDNLTINRIVRLFRQMVDELDDTPTLTSGEHLRLQYQAVMRLAAEMKVQGALVGEPTFILRAGDPASPGAVRRWAELAEDMDYPADHITAARECHTAMVKWRRGSNNTNPLLS